MKRSRQSLAEELIERLSAILSKNRGRPDDEDCLAREVRHAVDSVLQETDSLPTTPLRQKVTPPMLAKLWGISSDKILHWIRTGELQAVNVATDRSSRPRYLIDAQAIKAFEAARSIQPVRTTSRRKRIQDNGVIPFF